MRNYFTFKQLLFLLLAFSGSPSLAAAGINEINGLIINRTISLSGHAFYKKFSAHWLVTNLAQPYNLIVSEKPSARWGNLIIISSQHQVLYRTSIRPGKQLKQNTIKEAASTVSQNILNRLLVKNSSQDIAPVGY